MDAESAALVHAARAYRDLIDRRDEFDREAFVASAVARVSDLFAVAARVDEPEVDGPVLDLPPHDVWERTHSALQAKLGDRDLFREIFDPYSTDEEPVTGSLADALADVYTHATAAVALADAGHELAAIWQLRFGWEDLWGHHALDAMRALHAVMTGDVP